VGYMQQYEAVVGNGEHNREVEFLASSDENAYKRACMSCGKGEFVVELVSSAKSSKLVVYTDAVGWVGVTFSSTRNSTISGWGSLEDV
jgi:hypothetical protein